MSINISNTLPAAPAGSTNVLWQTDGAGNVSAYITAAVELVGDGFNATGQTANIGTTSLITTPTAGRYRISGYLIITTVGTTSTLPAIVLAWNDADNGQAQTLTLTTSGLTTNSLTTKSQSDAFISVGASAALQFSTTGYASTGTPMQFAIHIVVEAL